MAKEEKLQDKFFRFDVHAFPSPLSEFSSSDMNDGKEAMLARYEYKDMGGAQPPITYYTSTFAHDTYMAIAEVSGYRLIVFIADEESLMLFRQKYGFAGSMLASMIMPPQPEPPNNTTLVKLNIRALR